MNIILRNIIAASLLLTATAASAQHQPQNIEDWMYSNISRVIDAKVEVQKSLGQERDVLTEGTPLKWRCDIYTFTLPKRQRALLEEMKKAFEANGRENPNCYGVNSLSDGADGNGSSQRNLMIGEDMGRYVTIGKDYDNYININILDAADSTKTHRYAYALEWRNGGKGTTDVRYIVTYAKMPLAGSSNIRQAWPYLDLGKGRIVERRFDSRTAGLHWDGKVYPLSALDSLMRDADQRRTEVDSLRQKVFKAFSTPKGMVVWADTLDHDTDPVTDVILRLQQGKDISSDDLLCNDNILLIFSQLKQQYLAGQNREFNAISIYNLCRKANIYGFFNDKYSKEELELLKREVTELIAKAEETSEKVYFGLALSQLMKIE